MTTAIAIIPARLASSRLPNKVLADIHGKPLIWHVWNRVQQATAFSEVYIATDSVEVQSAVEGWGGQALMTSSTCRSGTDRLAECLGRIHADYIVNVQGDEPLIDPNVLDSMVRHWQETPADLMTLVFQITDTEELFSETVVKVARSAKGEALYFSRSPVPFMRDVPRSEWLSRQKYWGHTGVYGYTPNALAAYPALPISPLETAEQLEQLRFLDAGYRFHTYEASYRSVAVDVPADLERVREIIGRRTTP